MSDDTHDREAQAAWHQQRLQALQAPDGWLTLAGLVWLEDGRHSVGSGASCAVRLPGGDSTPALWGTLQVQGAVAEWTDATGRPQSLQTDRSGQPTVIRHGRISFLLIERQGALALRVRDEQAATRTGFRGTELFAFNPACRIPAHWDGAAAWFAFDGQRYGLRPQNAAADPLHFVIADSTSGRQSYGGGRFLYVPLEAARAGDFTLDLNRLFNPPCAFTAFAVCPVPPPENRLAFAVLAGEKAYSHEPPAGVV